MGVLSKLPRRARWAVPAGAVAAVGLVIAGSALAGAQAAPQLPTRTTAQLLAAVDARSALPSALQATVQETVSLGLPALPGSSTGDPLSGLSLLSGTHTFRVWYDGPSRVRVAIPVPLGEADLRRDGRDVWVWDSRTNQATHYVLPAGPGAAPAQETPLPSAPTPQQVARQILAAVGSTTTVGLQSSVTVAGQAAYQLTLAPKDSRSLIGQVRIAIDAEYSLPLQVQVFARGASSPAFQVAYTSLSFARPDPSNFPFTPPPGARVKTVTAPAAAGFPVGVPQQAWPVRPAGATPGTRDVIVSVSPADGQVMNVASGCVHPVGAPAAVLRRVSAQLPTSMPRAARAAVLKVFATGQPGCRPIHAPPGCVMISSSADAVSPGVIFGGGPRVLGRDWLSVLVLPGPGGPGAGLTPADAGGGVVWSTPGEGAAPSGTQTSTVPIDGSAVPGGPGINVPGLGGALLRAARPVHGSWGSGRLITTSLISVLITDSGECLIGAVQPSVLYADAAQLG